VGATETLGLNLSRRPVDVSRMWPRSTAVRIALVIVVGVVGLVVAGIATVTSWDDSRRSTDATADEIGDTLDLVDAPRWPLRWVENDTVVFQT
jgi:hypothetical protein